MRSVQRLSLLQSVAPYRSQEKALTSRELENLVAYALSAGCRKPPVDQNNAVRRGAFVYHVQYMHRRTVLSLLTSSTLARPMRAQSVAPYRSQEKALTSRELENLVAYARLFGYVRHFHPSDEAERADWDALTIAGVTRVESAANPAALAVTLQQAFASVAPTIRVFPKGTPVERWLPTDQERKIRRVFWRHRGYRVELNVPDWMNTWTRQRILAPVDGRPEVVEVNLAGGVAALVPISLPADEIGTLPRTSNADTSPSATGDSPFSGDERATRLASVIIAWNVFEHFYPYWDVLETDWPGALSSALQAAATDTAHSFLRTLRRMTKAAHDGHVKVFWDAAPEPNAAAPVGWDWVESRLVITDVPDAQGQPIQVGDFVLSIDGTPTAEAIREIEAEISSPSASWRLARLLNFAGAAQRMFGSLGEGPQSRPLVLELNPWNDPRKRRTATLTRSVSRAPVREHRPPRIAELKPGILYVDLTRLTAADWNAALPQMAGASSLIFDVRGYPRLNFEILGNLSPAPLLQQRWYTPVITHPDRTRWEFDISERATIPPVKPYLAGRKVFLIDGRAISFADSWMAMAEHYRLGEIVGEATAGTTGLANRIMLPGGYGMFFTGQKVLKHDGTQHHGVGVRPTVPASRTVAGVAAQRDEVLERALKVLDAK